ncbi:hypothetical protein HF325_005404 [Metschnikowia pulcherrima]|uniref:Reverse transcriptase domain-containing protein n=1 Tax=Metschnikowia pulcherrima TaxID=27326 RepID=A0A8H7GNY4_9ASCO|nr:hypothetical protein HF325_005404 [Metschnikowia pulcherrima]
MTLSALFTPGMVRYLLQNDSEESEGRSKYKAAQLFFQAKKPEQVIFTSLKNEALGIEAKTSPEMVKLATDYYRNLYLSPPQALWNDLKRYLKPIRPRLSGLQRQELERPFTLKELEQALGLMDKSKAPGPDGLQYPVLQYYWDSIGASLTRAANDLMTTGRLPHSFTKVLITLIPKHNVETSKDIKDQRPISLSNTCIKVISKAVCTRLQKVMEHLVDDVNIYLGNESDYELAAEAIKGFERVSNSRVSETKTKLLGISTDYSRYQQNVLPYPQSYLWSEDLTYLGLTLKGVDWLRFISKLPFMTMKQGYLHIDLINRAVGTNTFVSSKTVYKDLVQCMTPRQLKTMDQGIHKVFKGVSLNKLYARPKKGGYGLLEMQTQMQGHRAAVLVSTLGEATDWYTKYLRLKLTHHMAKIITRRKKTDISRAQGLQCADFLLEQTGRFFKNLEWTFTRNEICYLKAWEQVVSRTRLYDITTLPVVAETCPSASEAPIVSGHRSTLTEPEAMICHPVNFRSLSKKKQEKLPPIMPERFLEICPAAASQRRWEKFWKQLHTFEWKKHKDFKALHHFNFGSHVPMHDTKTSLRGFRCHLCLSPVDSRQFLYHLYTECRCSEVLWDKLNIQAPMNLNSMLAPLNTTYENLRNLNWYVDTVRQVYSSRRREATGGTVLQPLLNRHLKKALERSKIRTS